MANERVVRILDTGFINGMDCGSKLIILSRDLMRTDFAVINSRMVYLRYFIPIRCVNQLIVCPLQSKAVLTYSLCT